MREAAALVLAALLSRSALAAELGQDADLRAIVDALEHGPGDVTQLLISRPDGGPLPPAATLHLDGARAVAAPVQTEREGVHWARLPVWRDGGRLALDWGGLHAELPAVAPPAVDGQLPPRTVAATGSRKVTLRVSGALAARPGDLRLGFGEGEVMGLRAEGETVVVDWRPGPAPFARSVPVVLADAAHPARTPSLSVIQLWARPAIPVTTRPGVAVRAEVGGRSYGPFVADDSGVARVVVEVRPGEQVARLTLEDPSGGTNATTLSLAGDARPGLTATWSGAAAGGPVAPSVLLGAVRPDGRPWTGTPPRCVSSFGEELPVVALGPGLYRASPGAAPVEGPVEQQVQCDLAMLAQDSVVLPTLAGRSASVGLRLDPPELSSAAPRAVVRAWAENGGGERLAPEGLVVEADRGVLFETAVEPGQLRQAYDGAAAVSAGGDRIEVRLVPGTGVGPVDELALTCHEEAAGVVVDLRAADRQGRPLEGAELVLHHGDHSGRLVTGEDGGASLSLPGIRPGAVVSAAAPERAGVQTLCLPVARLPHAGLLRAEVAVPIVEGAVREVFLSSAPQSLELSAEAEARITLRLVDGGGGPVRDDSVELSASRGTVGPLKRRPDGSYTARYTPDQASELGRVQLTARSPQGRFATTSTELELVPAGTRLWPGAAVGWLGGLNGASSPYVSLVLGLPLTKLDERIHLRGSVGTYRLQAAVPAEGPEDGVDLQLVAVPIGLGSDLRVDRSRFSTWTGASIVLAPMRLEVRYGDEDTVSGAQLAPPGAELRIGAGWGLRSGELAAELGWLFLASGAVDQGWQGSLGGVLATVGYRARL
jgi:hypothetical protein